MRITETTFLLLIFALGFTSVLLIFPPQQAKAETLSPWASTTGYPSNITDQSCVTSGGYIYCVGGRTNSSFTTIVNSVYYAPLSSSGVGVWTSTTNYPTNIFRHSCVASGGYIYCVGGQTGLGPATDAVYYAPLSSSGLGTWTATTSYPYGIAQQACVTSGSFIYCTGPGAVVYYAPLSSAGVGAWTLSTASLPVSVIYSSAQACVASGSYIYCVGGALSGSGSPHSNAVYYAPVLLSGALGNWTLNSINYPTRIIEQSCSASEGYIYCVGGTAFSNPFQGVVTNATYFAPLSSSGGVGVWTSTASYPTGVTDESCMVSGGYIYCVGGDTRTATTNAVYYAPIIISSQNTTSTTTTTTTTSSTISTNSSTGTSSTTNTNTTSSSSISTQTTSSTSTTNSTVVITTTTTSTSPTVTTSSSSSSSSSSSPSSTTQSNSTSSSMTNSTNSTTMTTTSSQENTTMSSSTSSSFFSPSTNTTTMTNSTMTTTGNTSSTSSSASSVSDYTVPILAAISIVALVGIGAATVYYYSVRKK